MMRMRWRLVASALVGVTGVASAQTQITVGPNVLVTGDAPDQVHFEQILAADPEHADRLIACSMVLWAPNRQAPEVAIYASQDRGRSWRRTRHVHAMKETDDAWDPHCGYGPGGITYAITEVVDSAGRPYVQVDRSSDGGFTWETPSRIAHFERMFVAVDHTRGPRRGWLYFHGAAGLRTTGKESMASGLGLHVSRDSGRTTLTTVVPSGRNHVPSIGPGVVLSDGTFIAPFGEFQDFWQSDGTGEIPENILGREGSARANGRWKVVVIAPDSAVAAIRPTVTTAADWFSPWPGWNRSVTPALAADASDGPFKDRLYLTWADVRSGRSEVYLAYSSDKGKTWSEPRRVSDDGLPTATRKIVDHPHGVVAVNRNGVVGVCWYDRRDHPDNLSWTVRCTASLDGGDTFLPSVPVSKVPYVPSRADRMWLSETPTPAQGGGSARTKLGVHSFNFSGGHTIGLAADAAGDFHPLWTGNPTGVPQLWTATVSVPGRPEQNGGGALAGLSDVSDKIAAVVVNATYVPKEKRLEGELYLENTSEDTLAGPMVLRVLAVESELGVAKLETSDNRPGGAGGTFDFTPVLPNGKLAPGERSGRKRFRVQATLQEPIRPTVDAVVGVAVLTTKVLGSAPSKPAVAARAASASP